MSMYFYDETDDWPEYNTILQDIRRLENEYLECRKLLQEAESVLIPHPADKDLKATVDALKKKIEKLEKQLDGSMNLYL